MIKLHKYDQSKSSQATLCFVNGGVDKSKVRGRRVRELETHCSKTLQPATHHSKKLQQQTAAKKRLKKGRCDHDEETNLDVCVL